jgi:hypothetical protein
LFRQRSRDLYKNQLEKNNADIAQKNRELLQKIQEVDALKQKYEEAIASVDPITTATSKVFCFNLLVKF